MIVERNVLEWRFDPSSAARLPQARLRPAGHRVLLGGLHLQPGRRRAPGPGPAPGDRPGRRLPGLAAGRACPATAARSQQRELNLVRLGRRAGPAARPTGRAAGGRCGARGPGWPGRRGSLRASSATWPEICSLVGLRRVGPAAVQAAVGAGPGPGGARASQRRNHSRVPGRRCSTIGGHAGPRRPRRSRRTAASSWAGESDRNGSTGAHEHAAAAARARRCAEQTPSRRARARRARLDEPPDSSLSTKPTDTFRPTSVTSRRLGEQVEVAQDQRALGQDRERVARVAQRADDAAASAGTGPRPAGSSRRWCPSRRARPPTAARPARGGPARAR